MPNDAREKDEQERDLKLQEYKNLMNWKDKGILEALTRIHNLKNRN
jgi:hypothetical protein